MRPKDPRRPDKPDHLHTGTEGERLAEQFLIRQGYEIRGRNLRLHHDEIDLLAFDPKDECLVFVEVKTRTKEDENYPPQLNMDWRKRTRIRRSARAWVAKNDYEGGYRLDVIYVTKGKVLDHVKELSWE